MAWFRRKKPEARIGLAVDDSELAALMPRVTESSLTAELHQRARDNTPVAQGQAWAHTQVFSYLELLTREDSPLYYGVTGRPAILLRMSLVYRENLRGFGELLQREGADLYLQGHNAGGFALVRSVLSLPEQDMVFENPVNLLLGDIQEFFIAACQKEEIELHLAHTHDAQVLRFTCRAPGIRAVMADALESVRRLKYPATSYDEGRAYAELQERFPKITDGLDDRSRVHLEVAGPAEGVVRFDLASR